MTSVRSPNAHDLKVGNTRVAGTLFEWPIGPCTESEVDMNKLDEQYQRLLRMRYQDHKPDVVSQSHLQQDEELRRRFEASRRLAQSWVDWILGEK